MLIKGTCISVFLQRLGSSLTMMWQWVMLHLMVLNWTHVIEMTGLEVVLQFYINSPWMLSWSIKGHMSSYQYMEMLIPHGLHGSKSISLVAIYRPPYHPQKNPHTANAFLEEFSSHFEQLISSPNSLCITGDFNFPMDLLKVSEDNLSYSCKEKCREAVKGKALQNGVH